MVSLSQSSKSMILNNIISVKVAAEYSGYSPQYLRRLLRLRKLVGLKLGQVWLIDMDSFQLFLIKAKDSKDYRFGPRIETNL